ncbi:MAG: bifunctional 2-C-methyl-D-erythritol 4-phosphate cytidylyltransferase/2-C-methyl-D-erythritol 2,4-cyclodiphosphate synthase [Rhodospirillaceae bacterium]|nr:bifunctional 2-C-methyl-D-erythritol 4-phosphate cytidylyltransferase/2-C-methyl-D-erythritol 2,4-cyclodiphosphate synthase [Rhodospirillaceae bacterium]
MKTYAALILAAGRGSRFGSEVPKQYADLSGRPVITHAMTALSDHPRITHIQPVIHPDDTEAFSNAVGYLDVSMPVFGGQTRQESVHLGLEALVTLKPDFVLIHDGARPNVSKSTIDRVIEALEHGAKGAIPGIGISDTLKRLGEHAEIIETISRTKIVRAQTPQGFHFQSLLDAHRQGKALSLTDDSAIMEHSGETVIVVDGDEDNIKITEAEDLNRISETMLETRTGIGFDVHRFGPGGGIKLGGIMIPMDKALIGHSDADVVLHAATDAILGAIGDADIGFHFPPSNNKYADADSKKFMLFAMERLKAYSGSLIHLDLTIICEHPKITPHRHEIRRSIACTANVTPSRISVKATTTEGLGFTGRGEGIACQAVATVKSLALDDHPHSETITSK